jgi:hypothetical protein
MNVHRALLVAALAVLVAAAAHAFTIDQRAALGTLRYEKILNDKTLGFLVVRFAKAADDGKPVLETRSTADLRIPREAGDLRYRSTDRSVFDDRMRLRGFSASIHLDDLAVEMTGKRTDAGTTITIRQEGKEQTLPFDAKDYDVTSADEVFDRLTTIGQELSVRVLDLESLAVVPAVYRLEREEECDARGRKTACRVFYYQKGADVSNAWVTRDDGVLVRQRGVNREGSYEIRLVADPVVTIPVVAPASPAGK